MVERELRNKSLEMLIRVIESLKEQGEILDRADAVSKLADPRWVSARGYAHIGGLLKSEIAQQAISEIFADSSKMN
ncbi:MAG: hypothetical protein K8F91_27595 [Candidatus Obscuribacterales bacterium]|nr:hypothetical protein [Candidatus Obscuribacterales bacterium]